MSALAMIAIVACIMAGALIAEAQVPAAAQALTEALKAPADAGKSALEFAKVGSGTLKLNGLLPGWHQYSDGVTPHDTFRLRRAEIKLSGEVGTAKTPNRRTGLEAKINVDPVSVYGEYATGESGGKKKDMFYVTATCMLGELFQLAARYDWCDPNKDASNDANNEKTIDANYFLNKYYAKFAVNYVFRGEQCPSQNNDIVRVLDQVSF